MLGHRPAHRAPRRPHRALLVLSITATAIAWLAPHSLAQPSLTLTKTSAPAEGGAIVPGNTITYTIVVTNDPAAPDPATGVVLTDATPANTSYVAGSATVNGTPVPGAANPFQTGFTLPDMPPGTTHTITFQVQVARPLDSGTQITNTASVTSNEGVGASDTATHTVQSSPRVTIAKTSTPAEGSAVAPGATIGYSIVLTNSADATERARAITLQDPLPENTTYVAGSARLNGTAIPGDYPFGAPFALPELMPGQSHTVTFEVRVGSPLVSGTVISNVAQARINNHPDVRDSAAHTVSSDPVLKVSLDADPLPRNRVEPGQIITYLIFVENDPAATDSVRGVTLRSPTPDGTTYVEGSARVEGEHVGSPRENPFDFPYSLGTLAPGEHRSIVYKVRVDEGARVIRNTTTVRSFNAPTVTESITHRVGAPAGGQGGGGGGGGGTSGGGGGGGGGGGAATGGEDTTDGTSVGELAMTGLDIIRLLLLAITFLLAGATLTTSAGSHELRPRRRRLAPVRTQARASAVQAPGVDAWFYGPRR